MNTPRNWPEDGVLPVLPFDPSLFSPDAVSRAGRCTWSDHDDPAEWAVHFKGKRWATCDACLPLYARASYGPRP